MNFGFYNNSTKLFDPGEISNNSQTFTAYLFIINLNNKIYQRMNQLHFDHPMLIVTKQQLLIIEENIRKTA